MKGSHLQTVRFFDLFDYPLVAGSHKSFHDKNTIFLSEELAKKYFGDEDPIGKMLVMNFVNDAEIEVFVGGVVKKFPLNNTFTFQALMRMEHFTEIHKIKVDDWSDWRNPATFFELASPENTEQISKQFAKYIPGRNKARTDMVVDSYQLVPFKANYDQDDVRYSWANSRMSFLPLLVFTSMAGLILLIACFNLTNTSIATTAKRLKEVGVRKSVGAGSGQIAIQFLLETLITIVVVIVGRVVDGPVYCSGLYEYVETSVWAAGPGRAKYVYRPHYLDISRCIVGWNVPGFVQQ